MTNNVHKIAITTGDIDGIGTEITAKALAAIKPAKDVTFYLWRSNACPPEHLRLLDRHFNRTTVSTWQEAFQTHPKNYKTLIDICSNTTPAHWFETTAQACMFHKLDGVVTGPISKHTILNAGMRDIGHTGILRRVSGVDHLFMTFIGEKFNVLLITGHIPIEAVSSALTVERVLAALRIANQMRSLLPKEKGKLPICLVGVNPHSGEDGLLGKDEVQVLRPAIEKAALEKIACSEPMVPDVAFSKDNWQKYSFYVCPYHDQGLIPFKMIHGNDTGVHITAGLPFIRTSVDHGTAKDIFNKNRANPGSMVDAIKLAINLCALKKGE